ncbi:MAG: DNA polymerase III subunit delta [Candidatus Amulumruptor caecigallinarius]|nr:DNA polymerase III subunit delta [Candidatus Amulumruptor caecigallinarius]
MRFSDIPGNEHTKSALRSLVDSGHVPHALMLSGPAGAGKMLLARAYAQYLHCEHPANGEPCGVCKSCKMHESLSHPDLHFIFPIVKSEKENRCISDDETEHWLEMLRKYPSMPEERWLEIINAGNSQPSIYVNEADNIIRSDAYPSFMSPRKIFLIWLPERFRTEAANKLLKVIEEPSPGTTFVMVCNNELMLLPTIFSRVQRFHAGRISDREISAYLQDVHHFGQQMADRYAPLCEGSLIKADEFGEDSSESDAFLAMYQDIMRSAYARKPARLRTLADKSAAFGREKLQRFLNYMARMTRENFIYNLRQPLLVTLTPEEENFSTKFSPFINHANIEDFLSEIDRARRDIERNGNSKLILFDLYIMIIILLRRKPT